MRNLAAARAPGRLRTRYMYDLASEKMSGTSIKIIKNEVGCRDETVPKMFEARRHCEED